MITQYVGKMKALPDDMAAAGKKLDVEELVGYILAGLDNDFDSVISAVAARVEPIGVPELYGQLVYHEQEQELWGKEHSTANVASRGRGSPMQRSGFGRCRGRSRNNYNNNGEQFSLNHPECQLCGKKGHTVLKCFKRFDHNFTGEEKNVYTAGAYDVDTSWYADSGATDHITGVLEKLTTRDKYLGNDQVHTASGPGMKIDQVGHYVIHTPSHDLSLNNVLYVPKANKNLVFIHRFTLDNYVFMELHP
jgi:hypothetical protein